MSDVVGQLTQSALVVHVPTAEDVVSLWRQMYDPTATWGVPAHVTVLYPFVPPGAIDRDVLAKLGDVVAGIEQFDFTLSRIAQFGSDVLYLEPDPAERFIAMTAAIVDAWPQHQPYDGAYDEVTPHLTLAHTSQGSSFAAIGARVREHLPIEGHAGTLSLMAGSSEANSWGTLRNFTLG